MATREQLMKALRNADSAGDSQAAMRFAQMIRDLPQEPMLDDVPSVDESGQPVYDYEPPVQEDTSVMDYITGAGEALLTTATGATAGTAGYVKGVLEGLSKFAQGEATAEDVAQMASEGAAQYTYAPRTETGQEIVEGVGEVASLVPPVIGGAGQAPVSQARLRRPKTPSKKEVRKNLVMAAPERKEIKSKASELYKSIDESGATIKDDKYLDLVVDIRDRLKKAGHNPKTSESVEKVLNVLEDEVGTPQKISDIDVLRKVSKSAANSPDPNVQRLGGIIIDEMDNFLDNLKQSDIGGNIDASKVGGVYKKARELWGRNKKIEILEDADIRANLTASGYENGLRQEFRRILKNKKLRRSFSPEEIKEMSLVVEGDKKGNAAKFLGKFGLSEGQATSMVGSSISGAGGYAAGGLPGAMAALSTGQLSKYLSQRLTKGKTDFADALVRSGNNGRQITEVYLKNTPKAKRNPADLKALLLSGEVPEAQLLELRQSPNKDIAKSALLALSATLEDEQEGSE